MRIILSILTLLLLTACETDFAPSESVGSNTLSEKTCYVVEETPDYSVCILTATPSPQKKFSINDY